MIDEDAFGMLFSYCDVENDEYGTDDRGEFEQRFRGFESSTLDVIAGMTLPSDHHVVCFGHAVYVEFADADEMPDLLREFRLASARLADGGFANVAVLAHGSRWIEEGAAPELSVSAGPPRIARISRPSEPLRRSLDVETLARSDEETNGWGPGVYVDTEALEALRKTPKNAPTVLDACGAEFYRIPALRLESA